MRSPVLPGAVSAAVVATLRQTVPGPSTDRYLAPDIASAVALVQNGSLLATASSIVSKMCGSLV
jgi:histidine ammonia-lyase